jgi:hypothetical protein
MVVIRRPRSNSSLERIMELVKKNLLDAVKSKFGGFLGLEKISSS